MAEVKAAVKTEQELRVQREKNIAIISWACVHPAR
jgi:hypothetical protein